jgi:para-nitrobenzyl esterase
MRTISLILFTIFSLQVSAQCGNRYSTVIFPNVETSTYTYGENTKYNGVNQILKMDVYTPKTDTFKKRPCVVFCFGGAFVQGDRTSTEILYFANYLAQRGYVCASIDYRLDEMSNLTSKGETGAAIRAVQDAKAAVRYLKSKSVDLGLDTTQFFIGGTSAGGITAMTLGYTQYNEFNAFIKLKIDSLGGWEGTTNTLTNSYKVKGLFNFSGAVFDTLNIQSSDLPVYLNHATQDMTVPFYSGFPLSGQSTTNVFGSGSIAKRMKSQGNYYIIDSFVSANHPAFATTDLILAFQLLDKTATSLKNFLYKVLGCENGGASISENNNPNFILQNPVHDFIYLSEINPKKSIQIYNQLGNKVKEFFRAESQLNIVDLPQGIYFLTYDNQFYKLVKE